MSKLRTLLALFLAATFLACGGGAAPAPRPAVVDATVPAIPPSAGLVIADAAMTEAGPGPKPVS